jgi:hypothetical protein
MDQIMMLNETDALLGNILRNANVFYEHIYICSQDTGDYGGTR